MYLIVIKHPPKYNFKNICIASKGRTCAQTLGIYTANVWMCCNFWPQCVWSYINIQKCCNTVVTFLEQFVLGCKIYSTTQSVGSWEEWALKIPCPHADIDVGEM